MYLMSPGTVACVRMGQAGACPAAPRCSPSGSCSTASMIVCVDRELMYGLMEKPRVDIMIWPLPPRHRHLHHSYPQPHHSYLTHITPVMPTCSPASRPAPSAACPAGAPRHPAAPGSGPARRGEARQHTLWIRSNRQQIACQQHSAGRHQSVVSVELLPAPSECSLSWTEGRHPPRPAAPGSGPAMSEQCVWGYTMSRVITWQADSDQLPGPRSQPCSVSQAGCWA
jgi:hypothetical protein